MTIVVASLGAAIGLAGLAASLLGGRRGGPGGWWPQLRVRATPRSEHRPSGGDLRASWSSPRRLALAVLAASVAGLVTRWPAGAVLAAMAGIGLPVLWEQTASGRAAERTEAIATWTELVRDALHASVGLVQAIVATAPVAPDEIAGEVRVLADRLTSGVPAEHALRSFADDVGDGTADAVICALVLATGDRAHRVADLLGALADAARQDVAARLRIDTNRSATRSGVRVIVVFSLAFVGALAVLARSYLAPFSTPAGQVVLMAVGMCDGAALVLLARMTRPPAFARLLSAASPADGGALSPGGRRDRPVGKGLARLEPLTSERSGSPAPGVPGRPGGMLQSSRRVPRKRR